MKLFVPSFLRHLLPPGTSQRDRRLRSPGAGTLVSVLILVAFCFSAPLSTASAQETVAVPGSVEVKGVTVPGTITLDDNAVVLNGTALRKKLVFDVYVVALYLNNRNQDAEEIMTRDRESKRVHITMLRKVASEAFNGTISKNIDVNFSSEEKQRFAEELKAFLACFGGGSELKEGTVINIDFLPGTGMRVSVDDKVLDTIPGDDFYHAILRLWIGQPLQASIRTGLLGSGGAN